MRLTTSWCLGLLFFYSGYVAAELTVIRAEAWLDLEAGERRKPAVIVVNDSGIVSINPAKLPQPAHLIELQKMTLVPGLMDLHVHITANELDGSGSAKTSAEAVLRAVPNARKLLLSGFTTVRNVGVEDFADVALNKAIQAGHIVGPRLIPSGYSIRTGGSGEETIEQGVASGPVEMAKAVRYQLSQGAEAIKLYTTSSVFSPGIIGARRFSDEELVAAVDTAHRRGVVVSAHAHGTAGIIAAANAGVDSIEHGSILNELAVRTLIENGTYLVPTLSAWFLKYDYVIDAQTQARVDQITKQVSTGMRMAITSGVKFAFGTDTGPIPFGRGAEEFEFLVNHGMSSLEALQTATLNAAKLMRLEDRGLLKVGMLADIIAVPGNPLEDIRLMQDVRWVMKGGEVYLERKNR